MIMKRVLGLLRQHWPQTHTVLRGDGHFANPELMALIVADGNADFIFGLGGNAVLTRRAELHQECADISLCAGHWPLRA